MPSCRSVRLSCAVRLLWLTSFFTEASCSSCPLKQLEQRSFFHAFSTNAGHVLVTGILRVSPDGAAAC